MISNYNTLEEKIGKLSYHKLFTHFMTKIGYNIKYINKPQNDNKFTSSIATIELSYEQYNRYKQYTYTEISEFELNQLRGYATRNEKLILAVFFFKTNVYKIKDDITEDYLKNVIKLIGGAEKSNKFFQDKGDKDLLSYFEYQLFEYYFGNRQIKNNLHNMVEEINVNIENEIYKNGYTVKEQQKHTLQLEFIKKICDILDLKSSYDVKTKITEEKFMQFVTYWKYVSKEEKLLLEECFNIRSTSKSDVLIAKQIVNSCISEWNGFQFTRIIHERIRVKGEKEIQKFIYCIKRDDDLLKNVFAMLL
jgi:hypothetical protein